MRGGCPWKYSLGIISTAQSYDEMSARVNPISKLIVTRVSDHAEERSDREDDSDELEKWLADERACAGIKNHETELWRR